MCGSFLKDISYIGEGGSIEHKIDFTAEIPEFYKT